MKTQIDGSVYPDREPPQELFTLRQKADYLHRIVSAFDYGIPPDSATLQLLAGWQDVFDAFPLPSSPGYHALRDFFGWPEAEKAPFQSQPIYLTQDAFEGRTDGYEDMV